MADSEDKYILRTFDLKLAKTGFRCAMITGSYSSGTVTTLDNPDIFAYGTIIKKYNGCTLDDYSFDDDGICISTEKTEYRLMLIEGESESISEASLEAIVEAISDINTTLNTYTSSINEKLSSINTTLSQYVSRVDTRLGNLENATESLDERVTALEEER